MRLKTLLQSNNVVLVALVSDWSVWQWKAPEIFLMGFLATNIPRNTWEKALSLVPKV